MKTPALDRFQAERATAETKAREAAARRTLRRTVREMIPKGLAAPQRRRGRTAVGGLSRKDVAALHVKAQRFLGGALGLQELEDEVRQTALVILLIDGVYGTEPWRVSALGGHGGIIAANARLRYLETAARLLDDLRRSRGSMEAEPKLLEGVIDTEPTK